MTEPGERRPPGTASRATTARGAGGRWEGFRATSFGVALVEALGVALLAALSWALLLGILELSVGLLGVALLGGWSIGAVLRQVRRSPMLAGSIGALAWAVGLIFTWLVAMAILPGSSRTLAERIEATPFLEWLAPQFGLLEIAGLVLFVAGAAYAARPGR
jgi:hypothetical protein